jgi:very-short-patch-repair endonuclease
VRHLGGRADRATLLQYTTAHALHLDLTAGVLRRVARGSYVTPALADARIMAAACRGVVSHESAAQLLGLELVTAPAAVHLTIPNGARPNAPDRVRLHHRRLAATDVDGDVTTVLRTVLDCCTSLPFREALAVADSALRRQPELTQALAEAAAAPGRGRRLRLRVAAHVDPRAANGFESALRGTLLEAGLTGFQPQLRIPVRGGAVHVDLADERRRIAIEADSYEWHSRPLDFVADCRRYDELVRAGWRVLRFTWQHVMVEPEWLVAVVSDVARARR